MTRHKTIILGAGPFGLGAADRLNQLGESDWILLEATSRVGGLARSEVDSKGYTWDLAGHVLFSQDPRFNTYLKENLTGQLHELERKSFIFHDARWVPYPFQNNLHYLSAGKASRCLEELARSQSLPPKSDENFEEWIVRSFGSGIAEEFLIPYNKKVWAHPLSEMGVYWMKDRVSVVNYQKVLERFQRKTDDRTWGPNSNFFYPKDGGFGGLFASVVQKVKSRIQFQSEVVKINPQRKEIHLSDGRVLGYEFLLSSLPLDQLVTKVESAPAHVRSAAGRLAYHGIYGVGIGVKRKIDWDVCWAYFPDPKLSFYRVTHLSKYSPNNVPSADVQHRSSFLCEIPYSNFYPLKREGLEERCLEGLIQAGIFQESDRERIETITVLECPYAYPIPTRDRNAALNEIMPWLESQGILSRGRFGTWRYEIGNTDHAFLMGWEAVNKAYLNQFETIYQPV